MDIHSADLPRMVFRKKIQMDSGELSMDADMIRLLFAIDDSKPLEQVAREVGMNLATLRRTMAKLLELDLLEPVSGGVDFLGEAFFENLRVNLTRAIGPMGEFLIEDVLDQMRLSPERTPVSRAAELVSTLAQEVPEEDSRLQFQRAMIALIPR